MIIFNGSTIPGTHGPVWPSAPQFQSAQFKFFGLDGVSEIWGGRGKRQIDTDIWLHNNFSNSPQLVAYLQVLEAMVGDHGLLKITAGGTGGVPRSYPHCTFKGFEPTRGEKWGPKPDITGLLDGTVNTWWQAGTLTWEQLQTRTTTSTR
jgi:hypothetical protein